MVGEAEDEGEEEGLEGKEVLGSAVALPRGGEGVAVAQEEVLGTMDSEEGGEAVGSAVGAAVGEEELEAHTEGDSAGEAVAAALVEEEGLEACEGQGMGVEVMQRVGERVQEGL